MRTPPICGTTSSRVADRVRAARVSHTGPGSNTGPRTAGSMLGCASAVPTPRMRARARRREMVERVLRLIDAARHEQQCIPIVESLRVVRRGCKSAPIEPEGGLDIVQWPALPRNTRLNSHVAQRRPSCCHRSGVVDVNVVQAIQWRLGPSAGENLGLFSCRNIGAARYALWVLEEALQQLRYEQRLALRQSQTTEHLEVATRRQGGVETTEAHQ